MPTEQWCSGKAYTLNTQAYQALGIKLLYNLQQQDNEGIHTWRLR